MLRAGLSLPLRIVMLMAAFAFLSPLGCGDDSEPELPRLSENISSTVLIRIGDAHGTGIAVSHCGHILTNEHIVDEANESTPIRVFVQGMTEPFEAQVIASDIDYDIAIIRIDYAFQHSAIVEINGQSLNGGDQTYSLGYPHDMGLAVSRGYIRQTTFVTNAPDAPPLARDGTMLRQRQEPGTSGAGIFSVRHGRLVGLMSMNMWSGSNILHLRTNEIVVPLRAVRAFLDAHNISYCRPPPPWHERIRDTVRERLHLE